VWSIFLLPDIEKNSSASSGIRVSELDWSESENSEKLAETVGLWGAEEVFNVFSCWNGWKNNIRRVGGSVSGFGRLILRFWSFVFHSMGVRGFSNQRGKMSVDCRFVASMGCSVGCEGCSCSLVCWCRGGFDFPSSGARCGPLGFVCRDVLGLSVLVGGVNGLSFLGSS